jgi:hypothetical protein
MEIGDWKSTQGLLCRNYVNPAETTGDVPQDFVDGLGPEFAERIGREAWQGYGGEGPKIQRLQKMRPAQQSQYA